jgi:hypothetical protein
VQEDFVVSCPYCGEEVDLYVEADVSGEFVQDCEVCCQPWLVRVATEDGERSVRVERSDGAE